MASGFYDYEKEATVELNFKYLSEALTNQAIKEGYLGHDQFFEIKGIVADDENKAVVFECEVFRYLPH